MSKEKLLLDGGNPVEEKEIFILRSNSSDWAGNDNNATQKKGESK